MAQAFFDQLAAARGLAHRAESAGTEPAAQVRPDVMAAMEEVGINISGARPQRLTNELVEQSDRIVTMGCVLDTSAYPAVALRHVEEWELPDPRGKPIEEVRRIRDQVREQVVAVVEQIASQQA
jgi:arsenate reductase